MNEKLGKKKPEDIWDIEKRPQRRCEHCGWLGEPIDLNGYLCCLNCGERYDQCGQY